jgi:pimeloyl-ACP methyl ester carboxylesterase/DNA-binding CsgD family transcriptional regulator
MAQRIGFVRLGDSTVAYSTMGTGPMLIVPQPMFGDLQLELENPALLAFYNTLASRFTLARYDRLGTGMSDRDRPPETLTLDFEIAVLEALVTELGVARTSLFGFGYGGAVAAGFAVRHPGMVNQLVLFGSSPTGCRLTAGLLESVIGVVRADWALGSRLLAAAWFPGADRELSDWVARMTQESCSGDMAASLIEMWERTDLREEVGRVTAPTLVLHTRDDPVVPVQSGQSLAALIPGARFEPIEGQWHQPWLGDTGAVFSFAGAFLGRALPTSPRQPEPSDQPLSLTTREREVLQLVAEGLSDATIAERLVLSAHTVHRHVANIRTRLGQPSRGAAAVLAARCGLI